MTARLLRDEPIDVRNVYNDRIYLLLTMNRTPRKWTDGDEA